MNHINYVVKTMLVLLTAFTPLHAAEYNAALCNYCSDMEMQAKAIASTPNGGDVHVIDFEGGRIKAFDVHSEWGLVTVMEKSVSPVVNQAVAELDESVQFIKNLINAEIPMSSIQPYMPLGQGITSAHVLAYHKNLKGDVEDALEAYLLASVAATLKTAIDALTSSLVNSVMPTSFGLKVTFPDGTIYRFLFKTTIIDLDGTIRIKIEAEHRSGRDGDATIPDEAHAGYEMFKTSGSHASMLRLLAWAQTRGITIRYNGGATKTTTTIIDCTEGHDGKMTCYAKK